MIERRLAQRGIAVAMVAALFAAPTAAFAQTDEAPEDRAQTVEPGSERPEHGRHGIDEVKRRALAAIERRLETIERLTARVENSRHVTDDHESALVRDLTDAASSLRELATAIEAAETLRELLPLVEDIVTEHYVYVLLVPKVHEVITSDTMVFIGERLGQFADRLGAVIERLEAAGFDVAELERLLGEMERRIAEGVELAGPIADQVIDLQPEDWPEAKETLRAGRAALHDAARAFRDSHRIGHEIVKTIREIVRDR